MGEEDGSAKSSAPPPLAQRPTITVPPRASFESLFSGGSIPGFSPGPMTLLSNMFSPDSNSGSFSQLLAGTMASPMAMPVFLVTDGVSTENCSKELNFGDGRDRAMGYKQNRPMDLVVAHSPLFFVPGGLSPSGLLNSPGFLSPLQSPFGISHQQALAHVTAQAAYNQSFLQIQADYQHSSLTPASEALEVQPSTIHGDTLRQQVDNGSSRPQCLNMGSSEASQQDTKPSSFQLDKPVNDGYNWRKYGQKLVKSKEHPRSYYKCTHLNCPVKKKVERASDGHITEITYKGQHNHEVPQPHQRAKDGSSIEGKTSSRGKHQIIVHGQTEMDILTVAETSRKFPVQLSSEQLPVTTQHDEMEDLAIVIDEDNDDDEPNPKRRTTDVGGSVPAPSLKTVTEPKIVVQTRSEVDLLDDGYKWRKYGQKVVKGNAHPRSYYRCTFSGCNVRKHVERASTDPKAVITTYEGKHNHDIPIARNGSQSIASCTSQLLKPHKVTARKPSVHREMAFENKDQLPVLPQLKEGKVVA